MTHAPYSARFVKFMFYVVTPAVYFGLILLAMEGLS